MTESSRSKTLEVMRDGIAKVYGGVISPDGLNMISDLALTAYESHLQAEGRAVVPVEPTARMIIAGASAKPLANRMNTLTAAGVWFAMLAASPYGKPVVKEKDDE